MNANSEFAVHCLICGLLGLGHTDLEFAAGVCCSRSEPGVDTVGISGIGSRSWEVVQSDGCIKVLLLEGLALHCVS